MNCRKSIEDDRVAQAETDPVHVLLKVLRNHLISTLCGINMSRSNRSCELEFRDFGPSPIRGALTPLSRLRGPVRDHLGHETVSWPFLTLQVVEAHPEPGQS